MSIKSKIIIFAFIIVFTEALNNFTKKYLNRSNSKIDMFRCRNCQINEENTILDICGHRYCNICVKAKFRNHTSFHCSRCGNNAEAASIVDNKSERIVKDCKNIQPSVKLLPCNHIFCNECAMQMQNKCRQCEQNFTDTVYVKN
ncbi:uncharacterized protein LOC126910370 [Daktulosphaira vitifoliae]|uniref:uncharacterized protein LOC126910370 n=1 Tax=Daktulosphaira vitifoliae TaxID=58002 RepID=UPI0021AA3953|nr:uncharacterized protein LOC126910370 [Daktulosphaira vitifoliae]